MTGLFDIGHRAMAALLAWPLLVAAVSLGSAIADEPTAKSAAGDQARLATRQAANRLLCVHASDMGQALQVRSGAGAEHPVIGTLAIDQCGVSLVGKCTGDWCEMALGDVRGWVDTRFIGVYELPDTPAAKAEKPAKAGPAKAVTKARKQPPRQAVAMASRGPWRTDRQSLGRYDEPGAPSGRYEMRRVAGLYFGACVARVPWWDTLRIRNGPGVGHDAVAGIPAGNCRVEPAGGCRGAWCRVAWRGRVGWVNSYYLE